MHDTLIIAALAVAAGICAVGVTICATLVIVERRQRTYRRRVVARDRQRGRELRILRAELSTVQADLALLQEEVRYNARRCDRDADRLRELAEPSPRERFTEPLERPALALPPAPVVDLNPQPEWNAGTAMFEQIVAQFGHEPDDAPDLWVPEPVTASVPLYANDDTTTIPVIREGATA